LESRAGPGESVVLLGHSFGAGNGFAGTRLAVTTLEVIGRSLLLEGLS